MESPLVSAQWLHENIGDPDLVVLYVLLKGDRSELDVPLIPGSRCFDIKNCFSDTNSELPNTLPSKEQFEKEARKIGLNHDSKIVVYDHKGIYESPRAWWMLKSMGHESVSVLDGGLPAWKDEKLNTDEYREYNGEAGNFSATFDASKFNQINEVEDLLLSDSTIVLDARSKGRFCGTAPEPRKGLESGHMPGSKSLPFTAVLIDGKFRSKAELKSIFNDINIEGKNLVFSCGSGITACIILLAAELIGKTDNSVFDGSWTEWATSGKEIARD